MNARTTALAALVLAYAAAPTHADVLVTPYIDTHVAGDVQNGRGGIGASLGYVRGPLGFELDLERHAHFFNDADVADLVPAEGVDLNTHATIAMASVLVPLRIRGRAGIWIPYGAAGIGLTYAVFEAFVFDAADQNNYDTSQVNLTLNVGGGVMHALSEHVRLRLDVRYFRALVDESAHEGGYFKDYGFLRVSVGVTFAFLQ